MKRVLVCIAAVTVFLFSGIAYSEDSKQKPNVNLDEIVVKDKRVRDFVEIDVKAPTTQEIIPKEMINTLLNEAQTGSYKALEMLPSTNVQTGDAYGLALGKTLRLRGAFQGDEFLRNIEGLPVSSHGGGGDFIDFENIESINVYRGAMPVVRSFGVRNMTGGMDLSILWPKDKMGATLKQSVGSYNFTRTYARVDTGNLPTNTKIFGSFSTTSADKWRGKGGQPENRYNFEMGLSQKLGENAKFEIFGVYHELNQHDFRALTYEQASRLSVWGKYDYTRTLTGNPAVDQYYYDFTRQSYKDTMFLANIEAKLPGNSKLTIKPYYWQNVGYRYIGGGNGYRWLATQPQQYGFTGQYDFSIKPVNLSVGYWYQAMVDGLPPPLAQKRYTLNPTTAGNRSVTFAGWSSLRKVDNRNYHAPYIAADTTWGKTTFTGSLKYTYQQDPSQTFYKTAGLPDVSYDRVFDYNPAVDPEMKIRRRVWRFWEPSFSINHAFDKNMTAYFAYGTGYQFNSWNGQATAYSNNKAKFQAAGISFDQLWNQLKPERLDNFDLGFRYKGKIFSIAPTIYYSLDKNKVVTVYDAAVGAPYLQSGADATSYGAELEVTIQPPMPVPGDLMIYLSGSYNSYEFDDNIRNASNNTVRCKGKQIHDTPKYMGKLGVTYSYKGFSITPMLRYLGERYGDVENEKKIDAYEVLDLHMSYNTGKVSMFEDIKFTLSLINLLDKQYIGLVNTSDFTLSNSTSYYPGAPFTMMGGVTMKF